MKHRIPVILFLAALTLLLFACTSTKNTHDDISSSIGDTSSAVTSGIVTTNPDITEQTIAPDTTTEGKTEADVTGTTTGAVTTADGSLTEATDTETESGTVTESETEPVTETETEAETTLDPAANIVFYDNDAMSKCLTGANQCTNEFVQDGEETVLKLTTKGTTVNDPFIFMNYKVYAKNVIKQTSVNADDYPYVMIKLKCDGCKGGEFELFFCAGKVTGPDVNNRRTVPFNNSDTEWQYILFDLSDVATWTGKVNGFRLDFETTAGGAGEVMYIGGIYMMQTDELYYKMLGVNIDDEEETKNPELETRVDELLSAEDPAKNSSYNSYQKETASDESDKLHLWFTDMDTRTPKNDNTDSGNICSLIRMAKNEIEGCQAIVAADQAATGLRVYITDFENASGNKLKTELLWGYYFDVDGKDIIDVLPPVVYRENLSEDALKWNEGEKYSIDEGGNHAGVTIPNLQKYDGFDIAAGENQSFVIKVHTTAESQSGEYKAVFTVKDADGKELKRATVFVYVWNFTLTDETSCKTMVDLSFFALYSNHKCFNGDDNVLYINYYDYLLDNRVCAYTLPYNDKSGKFSDSRIEEYLNNPRVTAFQTVGWKENINANNAAEAYKYLSQNKEWLEKAYFYPIDEPYLAIDPEILNKINDYGTMLKENFPGYKLIVPMHVNSAVGAGDYFSYIADSVTTWCPHTFFFNTFEEYYKNRKLTYRMTAQLEKTLGTFPERMAAEQAGGDEVWWYVTRFPQTPEITLTMNTAEINYRILFWQQKLYNVDGFLYYSVTDWYQNEDDHRIIGINSKHETDPSYPYNVYGNGVLVYCGQYFGEYGPVGCYRLECVRDGIEDYEYLTMFEAIYGEELTDALIQRITTSISKYTDDKDYFLSVRDAIGNLLDRDMNK